MTTIRFEPCNTGVLDWTSGFNISVVTCQRLNNDSST